MDNVDVDLQPSPIDPDKAEKIRRELGRGTSINATAKKLKCGVGTVHRIKQKMAA